MTGEKHGTAGLKHAQQSASASGGIRAKQLSPAEIADAEDRRSKLTLQLENALQALDKSETQLAQVIEAERDASTLLSETKELEGFYSQRIRANEVLAHSVQRRAELEPRVENWRQTVRRLREQISLLPVNAIAKQDKLHDLARRLSSPLP